MAETDTNEKRKLFVKFKEHKAQQLPNKKMSKPVAVMEVKNGHYLRKFEAKDQPFEVENEAELQMLLRTGSFVEHKQAEATEEASAKKEKPEKKETGSGETKSSVEV